MIRRSMLLTISLLQVGGGLSFSPAMLLSRVTCSSPTSSRQFRNPGAAFSYSTALGMSDFGGDAFPSAMPAKPELTMEEKLAKSADDFIEAMTNALGEGVEPPPELEALKEARETNDNAILPLRIYELMIERGMRYDEAPETGTLTPTEFDIPANLEVKEVQDEFRHLYGYGMMLMQKGLLTEDQVKTSVIERLIKRTGLSPEEFDKWLGY